MTENITLSSLSNADYTLILYANDTAGNLNETNVTFTVLVSTTTGGGGSSGGGGGGGKITPTPAPVPKPTPPEPTPTPVKEIIEEKALFDISSELIKSVQVIGEDLIVNVKIPLINLGVHERASVNLHYEIKDSDGNVILTEEEAVIVGLQTEFIKTFKLPSSAKLGDYKFSAKLVYENQTATSENLFKIIEEKPSLFRTYAKQFIILLILTLLSLLLLLLRKKRMLKKKSELKKLAEHVRKKMR